MGQVGLVAQHNRDSGGSQGVRICLAVVAEGSKPAVAMYAGARSPTLPCNGDSRGSRRSVPGGR